jgi:hypothetical protein
MAIMDEVEFLINLLRLLRMLTDDPPCKGGLNESDRVLF